MTSAELRRALSEKKALEETEISNPVLYAIFDKLIKAVDDGLFDEQIKRDLACPLKSTYFPTWLGNDDFSESGYNFWFGNLDRDCPGFIVSGVSFNKVESECPGLLKRLFFGQVKRVFLRAHISINKHNAFADPEAIYEAYADGRIETISGFPNLKDIYLKLKERFFRIEKEKAEAVRLAKKLRSQIIGEEILSASEYRPKSMPAQEITPENPTAYKDYAGEPSSMRIRIIKGT